MGGDNLGVISRPPAAVLFSVLAQNLPGSRALSLLPGLSPFVSTLSLRPTAGVLGLLLVIKVVKAAGPCASPELPPGRRVACSVSVATTPPALGLQCAVYPALGVLPWLQGGKSLLRGRKIKYNV